MSTIGRRLGLWIAKRCGWRPPRNVECNNVLCIGLTVDTLWTLDLDRNVVEMRDVVIIARPEWDRIADAAGIVVTGEDAPNWKIRL